MKTSILLTLGILAATAPGFGWQERPAAPGAQAEALEKAFKLIADDKPKRAKEELDRAAALAGGPCGECLLGLSHVYASQKQWDLAVDASQQAIPLLKSPGLQARAYNQLGLANAMLRAPDSLAKAEEALRRAVELGGPWGTMARYNLAEVLVRRQSWVEAAQAAKSYLAEAGPDGTALKEARSLLCRLRSRLPDEPGGNSEPLRVGGDVLRPEILSQVMPVYPEKARKAGTRGTVILETIIDEEGCVRNIRVLQGVPDGLTESAVASVRGWVFSPATLKGQPVKVYYVLTVQLRRLLRSIALRLAPTLLEPGRVLGRVDESVDDSAVVARAIERIQPRVESVRVGAPP